MLPRETTRRYPSRFCALAISSRAVVAAWRWGPAVSRVAHTPDERAECHVLSLLDRHTAGHEVSEEHLPVGTDVDDDVITIRIDHIPVADGAAGQVVYNLDDLPICRRIDRFVLAVPVGHEQAAPVHQPTIPRT